MTISRHLLAAGLFCVGILASTATPALAGPVPLTECDLTLDPGSYYLPADLDCGADRVAWFKGMTRLDLDGHTITTTSDGIICAGRCRITGPGTLVIGNGDAIWARNARIDGIEVTGGSIRGVVGSKLRIRDSTIHGNTIGLWTGARLKLVDSSITGNLGSGIVADNPNDCPRVRVQLKNSTVAGNATDIDCGGIEDSCADLVGCRAPQLDDASTCDSSQNLSNPLSNWGVCSAD